MWLFDDFVILWTWRTWRLHFCRCSGWIGPLSPLLRVWDVQIGPLTIVSLRVEPRTVDDFKWSHGRKLL